MDYGNGDAQHRTHCKSNGARVWGLPKLHSVRQLLCIAKWKGGWRLWPLKWKQAHPRTVGKLSQRLEKGLEAVASGSFAKSAQNMQAIVEGLRQELQAKFEQDQSEL